MKPFEINVLNYHLDGYGHVNNARYLEFLEAARWDFFRQQAMRDTLREANLVVAQMTICYRQAARLDDVLRVESAVTAAQSRQIVISQKIVNANTEAICATAEVILMPTDESGRVFRLPENIREKFFQIIEIK